MSQNCRLRNRTTKGTRSPISLKRNPPSFPFTFSLKSRTPSEEINVMFILNTHKHTHEFHIWFFIDSELVQPSNKTDFQFLYGHCIRVLQDYTRIPPVRSRTKECKISPYSVLNCVHSTYNQVRPFRPVDLQPPTNPSPTPPSSPKVQYPSNYLKD